LSVIKHNSYAEILIKCPHCHQNLNIKIDNIHRDKAERFPFEFLYIHGESNARHAITLYLDYDFQVRGIEVVKYIKDEENKDIDIPEKKIFLKRKSKIPPMAKKLGIISQKDYEILQLADGTNSILDISQKLKIPLIELSKIIQKLKDKEFIEEFK